MLLNGWNEIPEVFTWKAVNQLRDFIINNPVTPIIYSTRRTRQSPPLSREIIIHIEPLSKEQKNTIIHGSDLSKTSQLVHEIQNNSILNAVTNTPLFFGAVIELARSNDQLPTTRFKILEKFIEHIETSSEHSAALNTGPCAGFHRRYLDHIANAMTLAGKITLSHDELKEIIAECSRILQFKGHIGNVPSSTAIVDCLVHHHILVQSLSPVNAYRFFHHQFQEWFAAEWLNQHVTEIFINKNLEIIFEFQRDILNHNRWKESLCFLIEKLSEEGKEKNDIAAELIRWTIPVDMLLASELAGVAGENIWTKISNEFGNLLRKWYSIDSNSHRKCALTAMLATGAPDFHDIIWPLLESDDQQVRLTTYRLISPFPITCLGPTWRARYDKWNEDLRVEFVHGLWYPDPSNIGHITEIAKADDSLEVKLACMHFIEYVGEYEILVEILTDLPLSNWTKAISEHILIRLPEKYLRQLIPQLKSVLASSQEPSIRCAILEILNIVDDPEWLESVKSEIENIQYLPSYLDDLHKKSPDWTSKWIEDHFLDGMLRDDKFAKYLGWLPETALNKLAQLVLNSTLDEIATRKCIKLFAKSESKVAVTTLLKKYIGIISKGKNETSTRNLNLNRILRQEFRDLSLSCLVNVIISETNDLSDFTLLREIVELVRPGSAFDRTLQSQLSEEQKSSLRSLVIRLIESIPNDLNDKAWFRAQTSVLLGALGNPEDANLLEEWIEEECKRQAEIQAQGTSKSKPRGITVYWNWYQGALVQLGCTKAIEILIRLLNAREFIKDAAWGLVLLSRDETHVPEPSFGMLPNYDEIYDRQERWRNGENTLSEDAKLQADAICNAIKILLPEIENTNFNLLKSDLIGASEALAGLNDKRAISLLLKYATHEYCSWTLVDAFHGLALRGIIIPGKELGDAFDPVIAKFVKEYNGSNDQDWFLIRRCFATLLFSDSPEIGIEKIRQFPFDRFNFDGIQDLLVILGACRALEATELLLEYSTIPEIRRHNFRELCTVLSANDNAKVQQELLVLLDGYIQDDISLDFHDAESLANAIGSVVSKNQSIWDDIKIKCTNATSTKERSILANILAVVGKDEAALALCKLIHDEFHFDNHMERLIEIVAEDRIPTGSSSFYYIRSRSLKELRERLIDITLNDLIRQTSAMELLGIIAVRRLKNGLAPNEPLHPNIELIKDYPTPWPLYS